MRCQKCQNEVPLDLRSANSPVACPACGALLPIASTSHPPTKTHHSDPQEILARWSENHWLDNFGPLVNKKPATAPPTEVREKPPSGHSSPVNKPTSDNSTLDNSTHQDPSNLELSEDDFSDVEFDPQEIGEMLEYGGDLPDTAQRNAGYSIRLDGPHGVQGNHFSPQNLRASQGNSWLSSAGQVLAYFGVGALTVGTVMVLVGYYGDNPEWLPTGWLTASAGQMLLFLGVITLVSGGMEQATQEIVRRVDRLGERMVRMDQRHLGPARPNFSKQKNGRDSRELIIRKLQRRVVQLEQHLRQSENR